MECKKFYKRNFARKTIIIKKLKNRYTMENFNNDAQSLVIVPKNFLDVIYDTLRRLEMSQKKDVDVEYMGVVDFTRKFSMCRSQFEKLKKDGTIKTYKMKGKIYVKTVEVNALFESQAQ